MPSRDTGVAAARLAAWQRVEALQSSRVQYLAAIQRRRGGWAWQCCWRALRWLTGLGADPIRRVLEEDCGQLEVDIRAAMADYARMLAHP